VAIPNFSPNAEKAAGHVTLFKSEYQTRGSRTLRHPGACPTPAWYGDFDKSHFDKIQDWEMKTAQKRLDEICKKYLQGAPSTSNTLPQEIRLRRFSSGSSRKRLNMWSWASHGAKAHFRFGGVEEGLEELPCCRSWSSPLKPRNSPCPLEAGRAKITCQPLSPGPR